MHFLKRLCFGMLLAALTSIGAANANSGPQAPETPPPATTPPPKEDDSDKSIKGSKDNPKPSEKNTNTSNQNPKSESCDAETCTPHPKTAQVIAAIYIFLLILIFNWIDQRLSKSHWSLKEALCEKTDDSVVEVKDASGATTTTKPSAAAASSSSRLISFLGAVLLLLLFAATSTYAIWALFACAPLSPLTKISEFMAYGAAIFVPYLANKLSDLVKLKK